LYTLGNDTALASPTQTEFLSRALPYANIDLPTFPSVPRTKIPPEGFKKWYDLATTDLETLYRWSELYPDANAAMLCGYHTQKLVLDVDMHVRHGVLQDDGLASLERLEATYGPLPLTWTVITGEGSGLHRYFLADIGEGTNVNLSKPAYGYPGIQIKGKGYVMAAGSIHPNGTIYRWAPGCSPADIPIAKAPTWLALAATPQKPASPVTAYGHSSTTGGSTTPDLNPDKNKNLIQVRGSSLGNRLGKDTNREGRRNFTPRPALCDLQADPAFMPYLLAYFNIPEVVYDGKAVLCPTHSESHPSFTMGPPRSPGESYLFFDKHEQEPDYRHEWTPGALATRLITGLDPYSGEHPWAPPDDTVSSYGPTRRTYLQMVAIETGYREPAPVPYWRVPGFSVLERQVYRGIRKLFANRWAWDSKSPVPLNKDWLKVWCYAYGVDASASTIQRVVEKLRRFGVLALAGRWSNGRWKRATGLYVLRGHGKTGRYVLDTGEAGEWKLLDAVTSWIGDTVPEVTTVAYMDTG